MGHAAAYKEQYIMAGGGVKPKGAANRVTGGAMGNDPPDAGGAAQREDTAGRTRDSYTTAQRLPVSEQLRDEVAAAGRRLGGRTTLEQRAALELIEGDTLTMEELGRVAAAFDVSLERLVQLTNSVHEVGNAGGPG